ncbi:AI-2E family transporter [Candidatus Endobugula sertula]|uniref:AI-2E family transporter n=1 Tax=Candidatus Endobugula sertula TaxID=62101 RepID=A0A1D2QMC9_9GAMM|nr:AI-2E family transporter [Candidatus Endobugula sertula]
MIPIIRSWIDRYFHNEEAVLVVALLVVSFFVLWSLGNDLGPVIAAIIIAFLMQGFVAWLNKQKLPHTVSVTIAFLLLIGAMAAAFIFIIPALWDQILHLFSELPGMVTKGRELLLLLPEKYPSFISENEVEQLIRHASARLASFGQLVLSFSLANLSVFFTALLYMVLVPLLVFFFLKDSQSMLGWVGSLLPKERPVMNKIFAEMNQQIANYVRGKVVEILVVGVVSYISFTILGLDFAIILGIAVGLSVVIPYIGAVLVTIPVLLIGFFQWGWGYELLYLAIVYFVIQGLDGNVLVPLLFSEAVKLHPVAIILSVLVFGGLWGVWGVFFAIPLATLVKAISNAWPSPQVMVMDTPEDEIGLTPLSD